MWGIEARIHKELEDYFGEVPFVVALDMYGGLTLRASGYEVHFSDIELKHRREFIWGDVQYFIGKCKRRHEANAPVHTQ